MEIYIDFTISNRKYTMFVRTGLFSLKDVKLFEHVENPPRLLSGLKDSLEIDEVSVVGQEPEKGEVLVEQIQELQTRVDAMEKEIAELKGQVSGRLQEPMPGSKLWFEKIASEIPGVKILNVGQLSPGKIQFHVIIEPHASSELVISELSERLSFENLFLPFECKVVIFKQIAECWLDRGPSAF